MTAYAFKEGRVEAENQLVAVLADVSLDFEQRLQTQSRYGIVAVALGDGELRITGKGKIHGLKTEPPEYVQIYFETTTSNFGVQKSVTIKLNKCRLVCDERNVTFEALPDDAGNVFTLSMAEDAA